LRVLYSCRLLFCSLMRPVSLYISWCLCEISTPFFLSVSASRSLSSAALINSPCASFSF